LLESAEVKKMELTGLGAAYDLLRSASDARSKASEDRQAKRLGEMQDAIKRLQAMPTPRQMAKQDSMSKVALLKKRLEALKAMLLHASPEQAKVLARQLKEIAKELASVAKSLGGGSQGAVSGQSGAEVATGATDASGNPSAEAQATAGAATDSAAAGAVVSGASDVPQGSDGQAKTAGASGPVAATGPSDGRQGAQSGGDDDLRAALQDAKKLLKEAIAMLKAKLAQAAHEAKASKDDKQAKLDLQSAEKSLADIDQSMSQGGNELYTAQGDLGTGGDGFTAAFVSSGFNVNVSA
jgi:hypothetical protein